MVFEACISRGSAIAGLLNAREAIVINAGSPVLAIHLFGFPLYWLAEERDVLQIRESGLK